MTKVAFSHASLEGFAATIAFHQPFVNVAMEMPVLPDAEDERPHLYAGDYVNALVLNESGEVLILPVPHVPSGRMSWQLIGGEIEPGEDPLTAVQRILQAHTGYTTADWTYLSSYFRDSCNYDGVGHFFCAQKVKPVSTFSAQPSAASPQWIPLKEIRYALLDGRIASMSHATTISLALLTILK